MVDRSEYEELILRAFYFDNVIFQFVHVCVVDEVYRNKFVLIIELLYFNIVFSIFSVPVVEFLLIFIDHCYYLIFNFSFNFRIISIQVRFDPVVLRLDLEERNFAMFYFQGSLGVGSKGKSESGIVGPN